MTGTQEGGQMVLKALQILLQNKSPALTYVAENPQEFFLVGQKNLRIREKWNGRS